MEHVLLALPTQSLVLVHANVLNAQLVTKQQIIQFVHCVQSTHIQQMERNVNLVLHQRSHLEQEQSHVLHVHVVMNITRLVAAYVPLVHSRTEMEHNVLNVHLEHTLVKERVSVFLVEQVQYPMQQVVVAKTVLQVTIPTEVLVRVFHAQLGLFLTVLEAHHVNTVHAVKMQTFFELHV